MIHAAVYAARTDVQSVVHHHAYGVLPFTITDEPLRPVIHTASVIGAEIPVWDIRTRFGATDMLVRTIEQGRDLAATLAGNTCALIRGHGAVVVGASIERAVLTAIYLQVNANVLLQALPLGAPEPLWPRRSSARPKPSSRRSRSIEAGSTSASGPASIRARPVSREDGSTAAFRFLQIAPGDGGFRIGQRRARPRARTRTTTLGDHPMKTMKLALLPLALATLGGSAGRATAATAAGESAAAAAHEFLRDERRQRRRRQSRRVGRRRRALPDARGRPRDAAT